MQLYWGAALLLAASSTPVLAQQAEAPSACEIHVWPSDRLYSLTAGAVWNNTLDSAISPHSGRVTERVVPPSALDSDDQRRHLAAIDLAALLRSPGATVVIHGDASKRRPTGAATERQTASTASCYRELTIAKNFFNRSPLAARTLRTMIIFDDFGAAPVPVRSFVSWAATELLIFPAKQPEIEQAAAAELAAAFKTNLNKFGLYAFRDRRKK